MCGKHLGRIGQREQLLVQRVVQLPAQLLGGDADGCQQVGSTDVADEQRVAGEHAVGQIVGAMGIDDDADRLRCVPGGLANLQRDLAEVDDRTVRVGRDRELGAPFGSAAVADRGAGVRGELEMAGEEVGMEVSFQHVSDGEAMRLGVGEVLRNIALGVDHHGPASGGVTDEVAGVREAPEVVLAEEHD